MRPNNAKGFNTEYTFRGQPNTQIKIFRNPVAVVHGNHSLLSCLPKAPGSCDVKT